MTVTERIARIDQDYVDIPFELPMLKTVVEYSRIAAVKFYRLVSGLHPALTDHYRRIDKLPLEHRLFVPTIAADENARALIKLFG